GGRAPRDLVLNPGQQSGPIPDPAERAELHGPGWAGRTCHLRCLQHPAEPERSDGDPTACPASDCAAGQHADHRSTPAGDAYADEHTATSTPTDTHHAATHS